MTTNHNEEPVLVGGAYMTAREYRDELSRDEGLPPQAYEERVGTGRPFPDYERQPDGRIEFFDCDTGRTLFHLPRLLAWAAEPVWHVVYRYMCRKGM